MGRDRFDRRRFVSRLHRATGDPRVVASMVAVMLAAQAVAVAVMLSPGARTTAVEIDDTTTNVAQPTSTRSSPPTAPGQAAAAPPAEEPAAVEPPVEPAPVAEAAAEPAVETGLVAIDPGATASGSSAPPRSSRPAQPPPASDAGRSRFAARFAPHEQAVQDPRDPATTRWAVLIGINDYEGRTRDNVGSRQDAEDLHAHLRALGWRDDHIVLLTDRVATRENIEQAIAWLARKTDGSSVAVFHFSGHTKQWRGRDVDGDGEVPDEALWPADNRHIVDSELVARLAHVSAGRLWIDIGACEAAGYADPGMRRAGRVLTFSSAEPEKSYEDPSVGNSVWGYFLIEGGMRGRGGDANGDGDVTVQEAFAYAAPRSANRTVRGSHGSQHPQMLDDAGTFSLRIPAPPPPPQEPPRAEDDDNNRGACLLICTGPRGQAVFAPAVMRSTKDTIASASSSAS
ncbi:MAG: caspase family protein [Actinobacteria bacterium]|nr:caspase family protein [Actinomycetota bacterium]